MNPGSANGHAELHLSARRDHADGARIVFSRRIFQRFYMTHRGSFGGASDRRGWKQLRKNVCDAGACFSFDFRRHLPNRGLTLGGK